jgi:superfamily II DNA or RNA helicase
MKIGYIYIRTNEYWDIYDAFKLGKTTSIPDREQTYITSEIKRGGYIIVIEIDIELLDDLERQLQIYFNELNLGIKFNAGVEFYKKEIVDLIVPYFETNNIKYRILTNEEIGCLIKKTRDNSYTSEKDNIKHLNELVPVIDDVKEKVTNPYTTAVTPVHQQLRKTSPNSSPNPSVRRSIKILQKTQEILKNTTTHSEVEMTNPYTPRNYQISIINKSYEYFQTNSKGLLIIPCGVGKTLISLWITQKLQSNTILIGVPNKLLLKQWEQIICILFPTTQYLIVSSGVNNANITQFLEINHTKCIIITTYASAHKVYTATHTTSFVFDMKILDEAHHLTSSNMTLDETTKKYVQMLNISNIKQLSLTATLKQIEENNDHQHDTVVVSNDNIEYFGEIIDRKCLLWAINEDIICDYVIQTIITKEEELEQQLSRFHIIEENDKRLFLTAFASLKSIHDQHSHHLLIYSNNQANSVKLIQYIKMLLDNHYFHIPEFYYSSYHSEMKPKYQKEIINQFEKTKVGIITCVYCLGEGWDFPLLDAVVFAENMTSNIRIVQSALRASRKNSFQPNKITKIILPILNKDDWLENNENPDLKKVKEVIYQMGLEDETITQKIKAITIEVKPHEILVNRYDACEIDNFGEYDEELTNKLKLKTIKRSILGMTYEKVRKLIASKNIRSKEEYFKLCEKDNRLTTEPEITYIGQYTNWIEYLSIPRIYYNVEVCVEKVDLLLSLHNYLKKHYLDLNILCKELCSLDEQFPPFGLWEEYYNVSHLRNIIIIVNKKKKTGI